MTRTKLTKEIVFEVPDNVDVVFTKSILNQSLAWFDSYNTLVINLRNATLDDYLDEIRIVLNQ